MILCASKDDEVVEYAMSRTLSPMKVAEYQLQLPDKSVLQKKLQELINMPLLEDGDNDDQRSREKRYRCNTGALLVIKAMMGLRKCCWWTILKIRSF